MVVVNRNDFAVFLVVGNIKEDCLQPKVPVVVVVVARCRNDEG
jgi:hypothetical protein